MLSSVQFNSELRTRKTIRFARKEYAGVVINTGLSVVSSTWSRWSISMISSTSGLFCKVWFTMGLMARIKGRKKPGSRWVDGRGYSWLCA